MTKKGRLLTREKTTESCEVWRLLCQIQDIHNIQNSGAPNGGVQCINDIRDPDIHADQFECVRLGVI